MVSDKKIKKEVIEVVIEKLLDKKSGDAWLCHQSVESLTAYIIEEAYELVAAISAKEPLSIKDELADVLYQVLLQAYHQNVSLDEIYVHLEKKLKQRHKSVFNCADRTLKAEESWLEIKNQEKQQVPEQLLDHVDDSLPGLQKALKMQRVAAKIGFDWPEVTGAIEKLDEEVSELVDAVKAKDQALISDEMADVLFSSVNIARLLKVDPEVALQQASQKFRQRFNYIENELKKSKASLEEASLEQMELLWQEAKLKLETNGK
ncbi:nucleoside triphosphate pyrophosphohydrolase [Piscirickettsia litoralis]|uniref:NTP pyrophosphohydrolase MazG-like domain-containing protein n=1 Tax=Piscirickettsia litoralis TaxID=1891921 RepID=A0ABX3A4J2_9GAMM|nr:nucleoside triphosphate pyrophosphohydrolase [Piscirickettsia litoralis]ODN43781.1 hypothetical protein BGC07_13845 [Piscirickettsia litoralis]